MLDPFIGNEAVSADGDYPKAAYRLGTEMDVWGRMMDMRLLVSREDEAAALREGWALHPLDIPDDEPLMAELIEDQPKRRGRPPKARTE